MRSTDPANWTPSDFEETFPFRDIHDADIRSRVTALLDLWRGYVAQYGTKKQTPLAVANVLFWRTIEWELRGKRPPHPGLPFDELKQFIMQDVTDDAVQRAIATVGRNIETLYGARDYYENSLSSASQPSRDPKTPAAPDKASIFGPSSVGRRDGDARLWFEPVFATMAAKQGVEPDGKSAGEGSEANRPAILDGETRALLRRCAVFHYGFTLDQGEVICDATRERLAVLVRTGHLTFDPMVGRYALPPDLYHSEHMELKKNRHEYEALAVAHASYFAYLNFRRLAGRANDVPSVDILHMDDAYIFLLEFEEDFREVAHGLKNIPVLPRARYLVVKILIFSGIHAKYVKCYRIAARIFGLAAELAVLVNDENTFEFAIKNFKEYVSLLDDETAQRCRESFHLGMARSMLEQLPADALRDAPA